MGQWDKGAGWPGWGTVGANAQSRRLDGNSPSALVWRSKRVERASDARVGEELRLTTMRRMKTAQQSGTRLTEVKSKSEAEGDVGEDDERRLLWPRCLLLLVVRLGLFLLIWWFKMFESESRLCRSCSGAFGLVSVAIGLSMVRERHAALANNELCSRLTTMVEDQQGS